MNRVELVRSTLDSIDPTKCRSDVLRWAISTVLGESPSLTPELRVLREVARFSDPELFNLLGADTINAAAGGDDEKLLSQLASRFNNLDAETLASFREVLVAQADAILRRAGSRVASRVQKKTRYYAHPGDMARDPKLLAEAGVSVDELLRGEEEKVEPHIAAALAALLAAVNRILKMAKVKPTLSSERESAAKEAVAIVVAGLLAYARMQIERLGIKFEGEASSYGPLPSLARAGIAVALGGKADEDEHGLTVATGPSSVADLPLVAQEVERIIGEGKDLGYEMTWLVGDPQSPFEPHQALDGETFTAWNELGHDETFPPFSHYFPGDHHGCLCRYSVQYTIK